LKDGRELDGTVISAPDSDIAIVKINATDLPALAFADSSALKPGQLCMAVGAPFGLENTVTFGHISALGRANQVPDMSMPLQGRYYADMIQTDASINMGNSGGPLFNVDGQVIGVNTAIYSPTGVSAGIGFAIPANQAKFIGNMLIEKGKIVKSMLGVRPENLKEFEKKEKGVEGGAVVAAFAEGEGITSPAKQAGIKLGDIITKIGTTAIRNELDLRNAMLVYAPGTTVPIEFIRDGKSMKIDVKLVEFKAPAMPKVQQQQIPGFDDEMMKRFKGFEGNDDELFKKFRDRFENEGQGDEPRLRSGKAQLGVNVGTLTDEVRKQHNIPSDVEGAYVADVQRGSVAEKVGIQAGDVITEFNGKKLSTSEDLVNAIGDVKWGETRTIKFGRYGKNAQSVQELPVTFK
ncbi:MAG TPA: PDZ domain-containing protein, partial [Fimbriimonas sp.]|nr:PDZ domain-containing protein [Fimbriimonas sp.]